MKQIKAFIMVQSAGAIDFLMNVKKRDEFFRIWLTEGSPLPVEYKKCFIPGSRAAKVKGNSLSTRNFCFIVAQTFQHFLF